MPLVTIITIVRNGLATLPRTLESVLSQDQPDIEYIVVDGGSTDGTVEYLEANQRRISLWVSEPDRGISDAFNKGIALSRGKIIGLLNSDDWYDAGVVRASVARLQESGADILCGGLQYWDGDDKTYFIMSDPLKLHLGMTVGHPTVFARRDCYREHGLFRLDYRLAMDYEWLLRASVSKAKFVVLERGIANMQGGGVGDRRWRESQREVGRARALYLPHAAGVFQYLYVVRKVSMGTVRRILDSTGLSILRRLYHRWLSPIKITSNSQKDGH